MKSQTAGVAQRLDPFRLGACTAQHCPLLKGVTAPAARVGYQVLLVLSWWVVSLPLFMGSLTFKLIRRVSFFSTYVSIRRRQATESLQRCHDGEVSLRASLRIVLLLTLPCLYGGPDGF
jgi:hypothetical protein